jgi:hypothetical protein
MSGHNKNRSANMERKKVGRRYFLKKLGLITGAGTFGALFSLSGCARGKGSSVNNSIFVPSMGDATYWEMLMFSSLQGILNRDKARIFLYFPDKTDQGWYDEYPVKEERVFYKWYRQYDHLQFTEVGEPFALFEKLSEAESSSINGYVIVDNKLPVTANIAANYASIGNLVPVTETILEEGKNILSDWPVKHDLRGKFQNVSKLQVYEWAFEHQWPKANHAQVANMGTPEPGDDLPTNSFRTSNRARDFTIAERGFFFALQSGGDEYELKDKTFQAMEPHGYIFGWDQGRGETKHISQLSKHGQLALGASTYSANFSFRSHVHVPGAVERFKQRVVDSINELPSLEQKIYLTFILSDGDSLNFLIRKGQGGQWQLPQRGEVTFGWEIQPFLTEVAPGLLDYFQATATDNDYFVNGVSGIGYFYPEEMPKDTLRSVLEKTKIYMEKTGQTVFTVMSPTGAISDETADIYNEILGPQLTGVMEGYDRRSAEAVRMYKDNKQTTVWLPTSNPQGDKEFQNWIRGLKKVASTRGRRPLFIPLHVPAHRFTIGDMKKVVDQLGDEFKVLPPETFYRLYAKVRSDSILINPPESFPAEELELTAGAINKLSPTLQNLSDQSKKFNLEVELASKQRNKTTIIANDVRINPNQTSKFSLDIDVPDNFSNSMGHLEYRIASEEINVKIPVNFS